MDSTRSTTQSSSMTGNLIPLLHPFGVSACPTPSFHILTSTENFCQNEIGNNTIPKINKKFPKLGPLTKERTTSWNPVPLRKQFTICYIMCGSWCGSVSRTNRSGRKAVSVILSTQRHRTQFPIIFQFDHDSGFTENIFTNFFLSLSLIFE